MTAICERCQLPIPEHLHAEITRVGRWTYAIRLHFGVAMTDPAWHRVGLERAKAKAALELKRHRAEVERRANPVVVVLDGGE